MIADSGTAFATGSIEWEGVLVGALDCAVTNTHFCVGCIKSGCSDSKPSSSNPPRWGRLGFGIGSDLSLATTNSRDHDPSFDFFFCWDQVNTPAVYLV